MRESNPRLGGVKLNPLAAMDHPTSQEELETTVEVDPCEESSHYIGDDSDRHVFQNRCLRRILQIYWPNTITNEELHRRAEIEPISTQVKRRRWRWIGHVLRQQTTAFTRIALRWTPDGQRKRGRPKETWRRTVEREMKEKGWTWGRLERVSADRHRWRALVEALCAT